MSLLEWLGEHYNPGPIGELGGETPMPRAAKPSVIYQRAIAGAAFLGFLLWLVVISGEMFAMLSGLIVYVLLAWLVLPRPETSNLGWFGFIDNPFRLSDDVNRGLLILRVILWPGRASLAALRDAYWCIRGRKTIVLTRRVDPPHE